MMALTATILRIWHLVIRARERVQFIGPLLARVTLGVVFMSTGWGKVHSIDKVTAFFTELGIPAPGFNAVLVSWTELVGGALLLLGIGSRLSAVPLAISMAVALVTAKAGDIHSLPDLFGTIEFTYLAMLVWIALSGPGPVALERIFSARRRDTFKMTSLRPS